MKTAKAAPRARRQRADPGPRRATLELTVQRATRSRSVPADADFRRWVRAALRSDARITVRIVGLNEARTLNRQYRGKDYPTNVLTFVLQDAKPYEGDLALCAPVITREARAQRKHVDAHYAHLTVHGVLHLQGYQHERDAEAAEMEQLETRILKRLGFADPYTTLHHG